MKYDLKKWQHRLWSIPQDQADKLGSIIHHEDTTSIHHNGKVVDLGWAKAESLDIMLPVEQRHDGTLVPKEYMGQGYYSIEAKIEQMNSGFHCAPLWFVADTVMPEIDVVEVYYGRKMQTNLHFGKVYESPTHYQENKEHFTLFNKLIRGWKWFDWYKYEMEWDRDLRIYYNGVCVRKFKDLKYSNYIIPIISAKYGTIKVKNFTYEKL